MHYKDRMPEGDGALYPARALRGAGVLKIKGEAPSEELRDELEIYFGKVIDSIVDGCERPSMVNVSVEILERLEDWPGELEL